jgi:hypothetical protein
MIMEIAARPPAESFSGKSFKPTPRASLRCRPSKEASSHNLCELEEMPTMQEAFRLSLGPKRNGYMQNI